MSHRPLKPDYKINPPEWMRDPDLVRLLDTLNNNDINARMVGGCIRNIFFNKPIKDIDIACVYPPKETIDLCDKAGIQTIPTGLDHGTITAHINGRNFEITTLRRDVETDGRHADITFTNDWTEDAKRRDFTINALYADRDGSIYDPLGTGLNDIKSHIVTFIGNANNRIEEDYLRILRFFRFYADYHDGEPDTESFQACITHKDKIYGLSDERIANELYSILSSPNAPRAIALMSEANIFNLSKTAAEDLETLIRLQTQLDIINIDARYYIINIYKKYIKNNKINNFFNKLDLFMSKWNGNIRYALYRYGRDITIQALLILRSKGHAGIADIDIANAMAMTIPVFPIIASDIMSACQLEQGPKVGQTMKQAEKIWIESDFQLKRDDILQKLQ